jgi:hypothetical protein
VSITTRTAGSALKASRQCPPLRTATRNWLPHRVLHGLDDLLAGADDAHVVGLASESLTGPANESPYRGSSGPTARVPPDGIP